MESPLAALLWRSLRVYQIFGANTEVGKTVFTTLLCKTAKRNWQDENVSFLKPVSTGPLSEADDQCELFLPRDCQLSLELTHFIEEKAVLRVSLRH